MYGQKESFERTPEQLVKPIFNLNIQVTEDSRGWRRRGGTMDGDIGR